MVQVGVDHAERYFQLTLLGREAFIKSVAPAALVRRRTAPDVRAPDRPPDRTDIRNTYSEDTLLARIESGPGGSGSSTGKFEVYPLLKKPGAPFADMITVGRTANNDVVLKDITVSRFHAFFRQRKKQWILCDAGSKNGTFLRSVPLEPRKEHPLISGDAVRLGDIATTFYTAEELFDVLKSS